MTAREKEALIENAIKESNTISEECKQELLKYYQKKKLYMKNGVFSLEGDKKTYEDMIFELQDENQTLKDNWDKLKEYIRKTKLNEFEKSYGKRYSKTFTQAEVIVCNIIIDKYMKNYKNTLIKIVLWKTLSIKLVNI